MDANIDMYKLDKYKSIQIKKYNSLVIIKLNIKICSFSKSDIIQFSLFILNISASLIFFEYFNMNIHNPKLIVFSFKFIYNYFIEKIHYIQLHIPVI